MRLANADTEDRADATQTQAPLGADYFDGGPIEVTPARRLANDVGFRPVNAYRADASADRPAVEFVVLQAAPFDQSQRYTFDGSHSVIGRAPSGIPVGAMAPYGPTPRVMFRAPPQPWDAGTELGT